MSGAVSAEDIAAAARTFERDLPHQRPPFNARNWGHGWHSLCSYQGKLKPAIAHVLIRDFTRPGEVVLDPMSGAGTIPLEACLQGRVGWGNDLQELAFTLTRAKVGGGGVDEVLDQVDEVLAWVAASAPSVDVDAYADFGMNGTLAEYFHPRTYREVLAARGYLARHPPTSWPRAVVSASLLHILHGNRPYALSRRSHPVTPFRPTGASEYRPLAPRLRSKVQRCVAQSRTPPAVVGRAWNTDLFTLDVYGEVDAVITSPPFAGSTRFFTANWMRLWMSGWEPDDFRTRRAQFLEHRQRDGLDVYARFFTAAAGWLRPGGRLIMHVGRTGAWNMGEALIPLAGEHFDLIHAFDESVVGRETFGVRDQGATRSHQYLFFVRR